MSKENNTSKKPKAFWEVYAVKLGNYHRSDDEPIAITAMPDGSFLIWYKRCVKL